MICPLVRMCERNNSRGSKLTALETIPFPCPIPGCSRGPESELCGFEPAWMGVWCLQPLNIIFTYHPGVSALAAAAHFARVRFASAAGDYLFQARLFSVTFVRCWVGSWLVPTSLI